MHGAHYLALLKKRTQASVFHYIFCLCPTRSHKQDSRVRLNDMFYTQKEEGKKTRNGVKRNERWSEMGEVMQTEQQRSKRLKTPPHSSLLRRTPCPATGVI